MNVFRAGRALMTAGFTTSPVFQTACARFDLPFESDDPHLEPGMACSRHVPTPGIDR